MAIAGSDRRSENADVLIIGAGASGSVAAKHLSDNGFKVVCLDQGPWVDNKEFAGARPDSRTTIRSMCRNRTSIR